MPCYTYSPPQVDRMWLWVYYNKIPIYPIFYLLKGHYRFASLLTGRQAEQEEAHFQGIWGSEAWNCTPCVNAVGPKPYHAKILNPKPSIL